MFSIKTLASRLCPSPIGARQVGQLSPLPSFLIFRRQGEQVRWPLGQEGTGPILGTTKQTGHSSLSLANLISLLCLMAMSNRSVFSLRILALSSLFLPITFAIWYFSSRTFSVSFLRLSNNTSSVFAFSPASAFS